VLRARDLPADFPGRDELYPDADAWINDGDSAVFDPQGKPVAGPLRRETGLLYADVDASRVAAARRTLDVAGHYARPDVFTLHVNRAPASPVRWHDGATEGERA
jgi:nitrilase